MESGSRHASGVLSMRDLNKTMGAAACQTR
jgi:hypothetical protein